MPEDAKSIPGYPTYYARPNGEIWRDAPAKITGFATIKPKIFKLSTISNQKGYVMVQPYVDKKRCIRYVHRLVLSTFKGDCPEYYECDHIDRNVNNNHINNLRWVTKDQNMKNRGKMRSRTHYNSKVKPFFDDIKKLLSEGYTKAQLAKQYNVCKETISNIAKHIDPKIKLKLKIDIATQYAIEFKKQGGTKSKLCLVKNSYYKLLLKHDLLKTIF